MQDTISEASQGPPADGAAQRRLRLTLGVGLLLGMLAIIAPSRLLMLGLATGGVTLVCLAVILLVAYRRKVGREQADLATVRSFIKRDVTPSIVADPDGRILAFNPSAGRAFELNLQPTLAGALKSGFANPGAMLNRLQTRAEAEGAASEDVLTRAGHVRVSVHRIDDSVLVWRIEQFAERATPKSAMEGQTLPMLMIGRNDAILFMNDAARTLIGNRAKSLDRIFNALPLRTGARTEIATREGPRDVMVAEMPAAVGRRAVYLIPLQEADDLPDPHQSWHVFQSLPVPLIYIAPDGAIKSFNRLAASLVGVSLKEGAQFSQIMEGLGRSIGDWIRDTLDDRVAQKSEFLRLKREDREVFVQVFLSRIVEDGEPALVAVLQDATELKTLEAQFVQSQKMQAIGQLAGGVAHDFNNLLTAISGHCDLLLLRHDQSDPDYSDLVQISQNANRAGSLVGQLLAFSRKQTLRLETIDMRDTFADLTHLLNRLVGEKITLTLRHDPVLKPVRADKRQLEQVLMNLVVNARDAMPAGGEIRIAVECIDLEEPLIRDRATVPPGPYVTVQVSDEGAGIPPDKLQKVFEPFYTTKRTGEGTGLGLSTAYGIIKQSNGFIFVDSVVSQGTTFTLYLPVHDRGPVKAANAVADSPARQAASEDGVILLVEDEAPVRAFASRALRMRGYTVLEADSAETALKTLEDSSLAIDVFVTDVVMPGMDGPSWVRQALQERPDVRVVFVSGYAEDSFGEEQSQIPNSVFLPKPFSLSDLTDTVQRQIH